MLSYTGLSAGAQPRRIMPTQVRHVACAATQASKDTNRPGKQHELTLAHGERVAVSSSATGLPSLPVRNTFAGILKQCEIRASSEAAIKYRVRAVRKGFVERKTKETKVSVAIDLDGTGVCNANTPIPFLNHMFDVRAPLLLLRMLAWAIHPAA